LHPHTPAPLAPPQEALAVLHHLALMGNLRAIQEHAAHIETLGEQYAPFAGKLRTLAEGFEERELMALVKRYKKGNVDADSGRHSERDESG
jgi:hypothetical protein